MLYPARSELYQFRGARMLTVSGEDAVPDVWYGTGGVKNAGMLAHAVNAYSGLIVGCGRGDWRLALGSTRCCAVKTNGRENDTGHPTDLQPFPGERLECLRRCMTRLHCATSCCATGLLSATPADNLLPRPHCCGSAAALSAAAPSIIRR